MDFWSDLGSEGPTSKYLQYCKSPFLLSAAHMFYPQLLVSIFFGFFLHLCHRENTFHLFSSALGLVFLYFDNFNEFAGLIVFCYVTYLVLIFNFYVFCKYEKTLWNTHILYAFIFVVGFVYLEVCDGIVCDMWKKNRYMYGSAILKVYQMTVDLDNRHEVPSLIKYSGYMFCPSNIKYGPYVTYKEYLSVFRNKRAWYIKRFIVTIIYSVASIVFTFSGECLGSLLIPFGSSIWQEAYKRGFCYRLKHYGICNASSATMVASGYNKSKKSKIGRWNYPICRIINVEWPRSLSAAFASYAEDKYMFLKPFLANFRNYYIIFGMTIYIYMITIFAREHNADVLISSTTFALFAYVQYQFQMRLSKYLNACVHPTVCPETCDHLFNSRTVLSLILNFISCTITIILLTYISIVMDQSGILETRYVYKNALANWRTLNFRGHHIILAYVLISFFFQFN